MTHRHQKRLATRIRSVGRRLPLRLRNFLSSSELARAFDSQIACQDGKGSRSWLWRWRSCRTHTDEPRTLLGWRRRLG